MPLTIQDVSVEAYNPPAQPGANAAPTAEPAPDMDHIRRETRRERERQTRLWAD